MVFRQAGPRSVKAAKAGTVTHRDPNSWISLVTSKNFGSSWSKPSKIYNPKFAVNDPSINIMNDGSIYLRACELFVEPSKNRSKLPKELFCHRVEHGLVSAIRGNTIVPLSLKAKNLTAQKPKLIECEGLTDTCSREPILELPDGSWVLSVYRGAPHVTDCSYLLRSFDRGKTWGDPVLMFKDKNAGPSDLQGINFNETAVVCFEDGEMLAVARADSSFFTEGTFMPVGGIGSFYKAHSINWGMSFSEPQQLPIFGQPGHLLKIDEQTVLLTYGYRKKPYGIRACISFDRGHTWSLENEIILRDDGYLWDLGYPMTIKMSNGRFLTAYYFNDDSLTRFISVTEWEYSRD
ncbi:MAG: sialidase family protein [Bacteriovoracia bacterium]